MLQSGKEILAPKGKHRVNFPEDGNNHGQKLEQLQLIYKSSLRGNSANLRVGVEGKNQARYASRHDPCQQGGNGGLGSVEPFDGLDHQK